MSTIALKCTVYELWARETDKQTDGRTDGLQHCLTHYTLVAGCIIIQTAGNSILRDFSGRICSLIIKIIIITVVMFVVLSS